jgi:hypothetical protein
MSGCTSIVITKNNYIRKRNITYLFIKYLNIFLVCMENDIVLTYAFGAALILIFVWY